MWQKILLQSKKNSPDQGFLTLEIILASIVAFCFLMFSLQALATAMMMKVRAQQDQRGEQLIQEDIERLSSLSSTLNLDMDTDCDVANYVDGYAQGLWNSLVAQAPAIDNVGPVDADPLRVSLTDAANGTTLGLFRTSVDVDSVQPHRTLKIFYQVRLSDDIAVDNNDNVITSRYVEIIPDEALRCP